MSFLVLLAFPITITIILFLFLIDNTTKTYCNDLRPPGPFGLPLIGNLLQVDASVPHISLRELSRKYGRHLISLRIASVKTIVVSSPEMAKQVLRTHDLSLSTRPSRVGQRKLSYGGVNLAFSPFDAYSRNMKKLCIVHLFNSKKVQSFSPIRTSEVSKLMDRISKTSFDDQPFNLSKAMISLAGTLVCGMAFGKKYNGEEEKIRFQSLVNQTQSMFTSFFFSDHFPRLGFLDKLTGLNNRLDAVFSDLDAFCQEIFDEHLDPNRVKAVDQLDLVDLLLRIMKDDSSYNVHLTMNHVKAIIMDLFIAGTDTAAAALIWGMTYLMKNPLSMHKAQLEVRQAVGSGKDFVTEADVTKLAYLKSVVKETLRLQPPAPLLVRESCQDFNLGNYKFPAKTVVYVNAWAIGRDSETWGDDSEEFKPERFMGTERVVNNRYMGILDFELIPFGGGRRKCPGMHMGIASVELTLANLLYGFDWAMPEGMKREDLDMDVIMGLTMHKKHDLCLIAKRHV